MAHFKRPKKDGTTINTSALPDIVFMLLFFFMVATKMRDKEVKVKTSVPVVSEVEKIEKKSWVNFILVGPPLKIEDGTAPRIQLDDKFAEVEDVQQFIILRRNEYPEAIRDYLTTSIKADRTVRMGLVQDIKQELRQVSALKLLYSANSGKVTHKD
ncbi:MAG: biopolymer transporter ExbD [Flavobacteriales bacterium]|nr:biopolymer transporter ExbD [Flavobacteriales bacterium]